ncbi:MAG: VWA domain-containing protein [Polyangiaceae bacterium]|nr:VWA domain-containing protein [Polyangiaceae bacterium]
MRFFGRTRRPGIRSHIEEALLAVAMLALSLVAVGVEIGRPLDRMTVILVDDRSRSIDLVPDGASLVSREMLRAEPSMKDGDRIALVAFGATAVTEQPPRERGTPALSQRAAVARDASDLEAALRRALAEVPPDSAARIVLVSDGVPTRGDVMGGASAALAAMIPVDVIVQRQSAMKDVRVVSVRTVSRGDAGESVDLRVVTSSPEDTDVEVRVLVDGRVVRKGTAHIGAGEDVLTLREKLPDAGFHRYDVQITAPDASLDAVGEDNAQSAFVRVRGRGSALVLEGDRGKGSFVARALEQAELTVDEADAVGAPADLAGLARYDLVVLSDIAASELSTEQIAALASYVRDFGGGLLLLGGDRGMGPGGYGRTPIEEIAPVSFDLKQDRRRASLAQVIAIDISGSMSARVGNQTKLALANEAASRAASLLDASDRLGVEHVDTQAYWSVPLAAVSDKVAIDRAIRAVEVGGGGIMVPLTLREAYTALRGEDASLKHLLLFSDGDDADDILTGIPLAQTAYREGITTSAIALGRGKDVGALEELATTSGGRFYLIEDAERLPSVFAQETILASRSALVEEPFRVALATPGAPTAGIDFAEAPELGGYVVTLPKPRASVHLTGPDDDPILALWPIGTGHAAAFTSDLKDRWGVEWTRWPGAAKMVAQTAREIVRRAEDERVRVETSASGGRISVRATALARDGRGDAFRRLRATIAGPGGFTREIELQPTSVGTYAADVPVDRTGSYVVSLRDDATGAAIGTSGAVLTSGHEMQPTGSDEGLLMRIAGLTGGKQRDSLEDVFLDRGARRFAYDDASRALTLAAAFALLLSVTARKLGMPEALVHLMARLRRRAVVKPTEAPVRTAEDTVAVLLAAKRVDPIRKPEEPKSDPAIADSFVKPTASPAPRATAIVPPDRNPPPPPPPASSHQAEPSTPTQPERAMSTAELLVARRRAKK